MGTAKFLITNNRALFFGLLGACVLIALVLVIAICCCIARRRKLNSLSPPKISVSLPLEQKRASFIHTDLRNQQVPFEFQIPSLSSLSKSEPSSPLSSPVPRRSSSWEAGALDLELYKVGEERSQEPPSFGYGRLYVEVSLNCDLKKLSVTVIRGIQIPSKFGLAAPQVFVRVQLLPGRRQRKHQTRTQKGNNPEFNQEFDFLVDIADMDSRILKFTVCDHDRFSRTQVIGYAYFPVGDKLDELLQAREPHRTFIDLREEEFSEMEGKGDILIGLSYLPTAGRITVYLMKGKGIKVTEKEHTATLAIKVSLFSAGRPVKTKKATAKGLDPSFPVFNNAFVFDVSSEILDQISFAFAVCLYPSRGVKRVLGRIVVGPIIYTQGAGLEHWKEMIRSSRSTVARWHKIT